MSRALKRQSSKDRVNDMQDAFLKYDKDGNGLLDLRELNQFLLENDLYFFGKNDALLAMRLFDQDKDGYLSWNEFLEFTKIKNPNEVCQLLFNLFDTDYTGRLSPIQVTNMLNSISMVQFSISVEQLFSFISKYDQDQDGRLSFEEVLEFVKDRHQNPSDFSFLVHQDNYFFLDDDAFQKYYQQHSQHHDDNEDDDDDEEELDLSLFGGIF